MPSSHVRLCVLFACVSVCCGLAVRLSGARQEYVVPGVSDDEYRDVPGEYDDKVSEKFALGSYLLHKGRSIGSKILRRLPWGKKNQEEHHVVFYLHTRETTDNPEAVDSRSLAHFTTLKRNKPVKVLIHGWKGYSNCSFYRSMIPALLQYHDENVIAVDWSPYGSRSSLYPLAKSKVKPVGELVAEFLDFNAEDIFHRPLHVMGHSLGGHVAGIAGQLVKKGKIGRISAFDPAGPEFSLKNEAGRLSPDSADFVDVIHTTANFLGFGLPLGHVDFYPNGGHAVQPGCGLDVLGNCSHRRSYELFVESLTHPYGFPSVHCTNWVHFLENDCDKSDKNIVFMGINTPKTARGTYYLATNNAIPYGKEKSGLFPVVSG